jgi:hypothetical protein
VTRAAIERTAALLAQAGADVHVRFVSGDVHAVHAVHRDEARRIIALVGE